jgi:tetratricopeptide (TPR) repeat protein
MPTNTGDAMRKTKQVRGSNGLLVILTLLVWVATSQGAAPPMPTGKLNPEQVKQLKRLNEKINKSKDYAEAIRLAEEVVVLRRKWQGTGYWQTIDARWNLEDFRRVSRMSNESRTELLRANELMRRGMKLNSQGNYLAAERACRDALEIRITLLGQNNPATAGSYTGVADCLHDQGKHAQSLSLHQKALAVRKKVLGEEHPDTAASYNNVASCLEDQGKPMQALPLHERALAIHKKALGEEHPETGASYNSLAYCLNVQVKPAQALPLFAKALAISKKALGEEHPNTAAGYNNVAFCLQYQGKPAQALPLYEKALAIWKKALGDEHPHTAASYNNVAYCLNAQGKPGQALPLFEKALAIWKKAPGEEHPDTAASYNNIAICLEAQGKHARALPLFQKALAIRKKALGEEHLASGASYNNLAYCLNAQGKPAQALPLFEKALAICKKAMGEEHPATATSYNNVAFCLEEQGKPAQALPLYEKALAIYKKVLGEEHPYTADSYYNVALCYYDRGRDEHAVRFLERGLASHDVSRFFATSSGFERVRFQANRADPREALAALHARVGNRVAAWRYLENRLARGLLDDLAGLVCTDDPALRSALQKLDERLLPLFGTVKLSDDQKALRDELTRQRRDLLARAHKLVAARSADLVWPLADIQEQVPANTAVVVWLAVLGERWACVLRRKGDPLWIKLKGSGPKGAWTADDRLLPSRLHQALADLAEPAARRERLLAHVRKLWFAPLADALKPTRGLPAVRRLVVVPTGDMARLPVEALTSDYTISYAPSATVFARTMKDHRALSGSSLLALGDPVFQIPVKPLAEPPAAGLFVSRVVPGNAKGAGIKAGDVLLQWDKTALTKLDDLRPLLGGDKPASVLIWREGHKKTLTVQPGPLGIAVDNRSAPEAVQAWRLADAPVVRSASYTLLPGTRSEVESLSRLVGPARTTRLLGSDASEASLAALAASGKLARFRLVHLATHGLIDLGRPERSALALSRDNLPSREETLARAAKGLTVFDGHLRVETIRKDWKLDADLVTLSACETALGAEGRGDGLLGFSHALLKAGARSVVLSRWKVEDTATALLMLRFYENLLGKGSRAGSKPLPRAEALAEARRWLRELPRKVVDTLATALVAGKLSDTRRRSIVVLKPAQNKPKLPAGARPYAHPAYWAAFVLIGDPN